ncbi:TIGR04438 family Trp-rich protein [Piscinibacter koreensis]|uniref:TIGR04438 family Trp-rich protein n=1 Tax=Piscinibacter koreensis TaxID=2742824 RepID=A0A7Y6TVK7_9BURK|nr:TIGR04438 family Trp-rich protein [Schlegelella koreensis]NUZ05118.1 TIGR04438 family Trp-rich protein [Schlegelella koreensis]
MLFVAVGVLLIVLNLAGVGPFGAWTWNLTGDLWKFCVPFALAVLWWWFSDASGLNKRREMKRDEERKAKRRRENLASLGLDTRSTRDSKKARP